MTNTWILVCNQEKARIFGKKPFRLVISLKNNLAREKNRALSDDKPGMSRAKFASSSFLHSLTGEKNPHEEAVVSFAKEVSSYLKKAKSLKKYDDLIIVAEPRMAGRLRKELSKSIVEKVEWVSKDLGKIPNNQLAKVLGLNQQQAHYQHSNRSLSS